MQYKKMRAYAFLDIERQKGSDTNISQYGRKNNVDIV